MPVSVSELRARGNTHDETCGEETPLRERRADGNQPVEQGHDHDADPDETVNIAEHPTNREPVDRLSTRLRAIRAGKPKGK